MMEISVGLDLAFASAKLRDKGNEGLTYRMHCTYIQSSLLFIFANFHDNGLFYHLIYPLNHILHCLNLALVINRYFSILLIVSRG